MENDEEEGVSVFLDASVLVAAALSPKGGSFRVLSEGAIRGFALYTTRYAYQEAEKLLQEKKYEHLLPTFYNLSNFFAFSAEPSERLIRRMLDIIEFKDAPVLAGALCINAHTLITLDRKHFLENPALAQIYPTLQVMTPGDFIRKYF